MIVGGKLVLDELLLLFDGLHDLLDFLFDLFLAFGSLLHVDVLCAHFEGG